MPKRRNFITLAVSAKWENQEGFLKKGWVDKVVCSCLLEI